MTEILTSPPSYAITQERGLVLVTPVAPEAPIFSKDQEKVLSSLAFDYLQKNKIEASRKNYQLALGVLAIDALSRGLALTGKTEIDPNDNLKPLIKKGLEHREKVLELAINGVKIHEKVGRGEENCLYEGPFALPKNQGAQVISFFQNKARFLLTINVGACDNLAYLYEVRSQILPIFAQTIVDRLPRETFPDVSLEMFPDQISQSKLVRNSLVSMATRNDIFPGISIEGLRQIVLNHDKPFNPEVVEKFLEIIQKPNIPEDETKAYLMALLNQADYYLSRPIAANLSLSKDDPQKQLYTRDSIYRALDSVFLLLHPALEERKLITQIEKATDGEYSLWDDDISTVMGGMRIPTANGLERAVRLALARGYRDDRCENGIRAWRAYFRAETLSVKQLKDLKLKIKELGDNISLAQSDSYPLPANVYNLVQVHNWPVYIRFHHARRQVDTLTKSQTVYVEKKEEAENYSNTVVAENNGVLPEKINIPPFLLERRIIVTEISRKNRITYYDNKIAEVIDLLSEDFLSLYLPSAPRIDWDQIDVEEIEEMIVTVQRQLETIGTRDSVDLFIPQGISNEVLADFIDSQSEVVASRMNGRRLKDANDEKRIKNLGKLETWFIAWKQATDPQKKQEFEDRFRTDFSKYVLGERLVWMKNLKHLTEKYFEATEGSLKPVQKEWTQKEFIDWLQIARASALSKSEASWRTEAYVREAEKFITSYLKFNESDRKGLLPARISTRDELYDELKQKISDLQEFQFSDPPEGRKERIRFYAKIVRIPDQISLLYSFWQQVFHNPIFPLSMANGMSLDNFILCTRRRLETAKAHAQINKAENELILREGQYKETARESYLKHLRTLRTNAQVSFADIVIYEPAKTRLIEKMKELQLAKPASA